MSFFDYMFPVKLQDLEKFVVEYEKRDGMHSFLFLIKPKKK
jgi:hypothetical protein